jgi:predicted AAA+ superfamily ATPase
MISKIHKIILPRQMETELVRAATLYPVVTLTGPRQAGKTTLVRKAFPRKPYINLEEPDTREQALADPRGFFRKLPHGGVLDEVQKTPELLSYIQSITDQENVSGMFILTGSSNVSVMHRVSQSLAGRTEILKLLPFSLFELKTFLDFNQPDEFLLKGFYPRLYHDQLEPIRAYRSYYETYLERDLRTFINITDIRSFQKFIRLCAGRIGCLFNAHQLASEVGVSSHTINAWCSVLEASYILFFLQPFHTNTSKRLIKSPKLYFYDVGLAAYLLGIENTVQLSRDPKRGDLFENMVVMELVKYRYNQGLDHNLYFYRDSNQVEVDLLYKTGNLFNAIEIKSAETLHPEMLKGLHAFSKSFPDAIHKKYLVYTGKANEFLGVEVLPYGDIYSCLGE